MDCINCDCYDSDAESCTLPAVDLVYACPLNSETFQWNRKEETMITNVEIKPNGNVYVTYGTGRTRIYFPNQPLPQTVKNFMKTTKPRVVDRTHKTRIDVIIDDTGNLQVYARRDGECPVYITDECPAVRELFTADAPDYAAFVNNIDDISAWTPFDNLDDYYNGIIYHSIYDKTLML